MEFPPHTFPLTQLRLWLAGSPSLRIPLPLKGSEGTKAVITGSVNSSELTLFDPVIHA